MYGEFPDLVPKVLRQIQELEIKGETFELLSLQKFEGDLSFHSLKAALAIFDW